MEKRVNSFTIALQSAETGEVAMCAAQAFGYGPAAETAAPEWVHVLPIGEIRTGDGRGPYRVTDTARLMATSLQAGGRLVIDENHATDLAAPKGLPAPAMGWIVELASRQDGIWGRVEWTADGERLVAGRAYRGISPVIAHDKAGNIAALLRASLVNQPNFKSLTTLHSEDPEMNLLAKLLAALSLPANTTETDLVAAVTTLHSQQAGADSALQTALQAQIDPLAASLGIAAGAKPDAVLAAIAQLKTAPEAGDAATIVALQSELVDLGNQLKALTETGAKTRAETFVDGAIAALRVGVKPQRDRFITMHMADPAGTEAVINGLPALGPSGALPTPPVQIEGMATSLNAEQVNVAKMLGIEPKAYAATLAAEQQS